MGLVGGWARHILANYLDRDRWAQAVKNIIGGWALTGSKGGGEGNDTLCGGAGSDTLRPEGGNENHRVNAGDGYACTVDAGLGDYTGKHR